MYSNEELKRKIDLLKDDLAVYEYALRRQQKLELLNKVKKWLMPNLGQYRQLSLDR